MKATRPLVIDIAAAAALTALALYGQREAARHQDAPRSLDLAGYLLVTVACLALAGWRRSAHATIAVVALAVAGYLGAGYAYGPVLVPLALATFAVAARLPMARSLPVCAGALVAVAAGLGVRLARSPEGDALQVLTASVWLAVPWSVGTVVRLRTDAGARSRREEAERAVTEERLWIAAEVHDVAGHGLSVIAMQAGVALHVLERRPEQARVALEEIRAASVEALAGLRAALADVRSPGPAPTQPGAPGLGQLEALLGRIRSAGLTVSLDVTGIPVPLSPEAEHAAYRIAQESLTNVLRHAGAARADVLLENASDALTLIVRDDGTRPPGEPGGGISGMRARAAAVGGTLRAGPGARGGFEVAARLPARMTP